MATDGAAESLVGVGSLNVILHDEIDEPVGGLLLAGHSNGRKNGSTEPRIASRTGQCLQQSECLWAVGLGDRHGRFCGGIIFGPQKPRNPVERGGTFDRENTGVARTEDFWGVGREFRQQAKKQGSGVSADLLDSSNDIDSDWKVPCRPEQEPDERGGDGY